MRGLAFMASMSEYVNGLSIGFWQKPILLRRDYGFDAWLGNMVYHSGDQWIKLLQLVRTLLDSRFLRVLAFR